jgi:serine protease Do
MMLRIQVLACLGVLALAAAVATAEPPERERRRSPVVQVFEESRDAVVNINTTRVQRVRTSRRGFGFDDIFDFGFPSVREQRVRSVGSGAIIHERGYIVTNAHVVAQTEDVSVTFADSHTVAAEIVAVDPEYDLAVLRVRSDRPLPHVSLGRSDDIMIGETVVAIGNPFGLQHTVTSGIVSAVDRDLHFRGDVSYRGLIQTDAAINFGNSGGPLLNVNAELIGINTAIHGDAQNVGFAIPVDRLWALLPSMLDIERRQRVHFGLEVRGPDAEVVAVHADSPAAEAGLRPGDRLTRFQDEPLRDGIDYYVHLLDQKPGRPVQLAYRRNGRQYSAEVLLEPIPVPDGAQLAQSLLGVELVPMPEETRRRYRLRERVGFLVRSLDQNGPADRSEIVVGDVILQVNRILVESPEDLGLALESVRPGEQVMLEGLDARTGRQWYAIVRSRRD